MIEEAECEKGLRDRIVASLLGRPLVNNAFRGTLVEAILAGVLEPEWRWCADGWGSYDFEGPRGIGLEVKQSAALQDWHDESSKPNTGRFDIAARKGRFGENGWEDKPGRFAELYVFAYHPIIDRSKADHRKPEQWQFHIVPASSLPEQKSIGLAGVQRLGDSVSIKHVKAKLSSLMSKVYDETGRELYMGAGDREHD